MSLGIGSLTQLAFCSRRMLQSGFSPCFLLAEDWKRIRDSDLIIPLVISLYQVRVRYWIMCLDLLMLIYGRTIGSFVFRREFEPLLGWWFVIEFWQIKGKLQRGLRAICVPIVTMFVKTSFMYSGIAR